MTSRRTTARPTLYLLALGSSALSGVNDVAAIKLVALPFDFLLAGFVYLLVHARSPSGWPAPASALAVLFAPTVVLNGAYWGQSDSIYTSALVATVYLFVTQRPGWAMIAFGLAFAVKAQAVFLAPLLLLLLVTRQLPLRYALLAPLPYLVLALPALALGRSPRDALLVYVDQASTFEQLTMGAPNLYQWLPNDLVEVGVPLGIIATTLATLAFVAAVGRHRAPLSAEQIVLVATVSLVVLPFLLPKMHDRYFFPADVMAIVLAFYAPRLFWVPLIVIAASLAAYAPFLTFTDLQSYADRGGIGWEPIPLPLVAAAMGATGAFLAWRAITSARHFDEARPEAVSGSE